MGFSRKCFILALLLASICAARAEDVPALIGKLNDADPNIRAAAFDQLAALGDEARPALRDAVRSARPAIAESATALLMRLPWIRPGDPAEAINLLRDYGRSDPSERASKLSRLLTAPDAVLRGVALRVAQDEPLEEVLWRSFGTLSGDAAWRDLLARIDPADARPAVLHLIARQRLRDGDPSAEQLLIRLLDREIEQPTASRAQLDWAMEQLLDHASTRDRRVRVAGYLRHLLSLSSDDDDTPAKLMALHALHGPLPGLINDLSTVAARPDADADPRPMLAAARLCRRLGAEVPGRLIAQSILALPEIDDATEAARQLNVGTYLLRLGDPDAAETVLKRVSDLTGAETSFAAVNAGLQLYDIYSRRSQHLQAAQRLDKSMSLMGEDRNLVTRLPNGQSEIWPAEEVQARISWHYYKDAEQRRDAVEARKRLIELASGTSADMHIFLDVIPALESAIAPAQFDAWFDRVYAGQNKRLQASPGEALHLNDLAWLCARSNRRLDESLKLATEAVRLKPNEAGYIDTLAEAHFRLGNAREAARLEESALRLKPDDDFLKEQLQRFRAAAATQPANGQ